MILVQIVQKRQNGNTKTKLPNPPPPPPSKLVSLRYARGFQTDFMGELLLFHSQNNNNDNKISFFIPSLSFFFLGSVVSNRIYLIFITLVPKKNEKAMFIDFLRREKIASIVFFLNKK